MKRLRILFVSRELPDSAGNGVERRAAQNLSALTKLGDVTLVMPHHTASKTHRSSDLKRPGIVRIAIRSESTLSEHRLQRREAAKSKIRLALRSLKLVPYNLDVASPADAARYRDDLGCDYDLVFCFRLSSAVWYDSIFGRAGSSAGPQKVVDLDDIESRSFKEGNLEPKPKHFTGIVRFWHHGRIIARLERQIARTWGAILLCSDLDADRFEKITGRRARVVPNTTLFAAAPAEPPENGCINILFVGSFPYSPNHIGAAWLVREVWPLLHGQHPDRFSLTLAGYNPTSEIKALDGRDNIQVLDSPPDLDPVYAKTNIVAVPIFSGSGTRIKVIEAMAKMRAVVSTTVGSEGLGLVSGEHYLDANDAAAFASAILSLANDRERRQLLAKTAYDHAYSRFSQHHVDARIAELVRVAD